MNNNLPAGADTDDAPFNQEMPNSECASAHEWKKARFEAFNRLYAQALSNNSIYDLVPLSAQRELAALLLRLNVTDDSPTTAYERVQALFIFLKQHQASEIEDLAREILDGDT